MIRSAAGLVLKPALELGFAVFAYLGVWHTFGEQQPTPRYHPASDPAAIALHERHLRVTGTATSPAHHHSIVEMRIGDAPAVRTETYASQPNLIHVRSTVDGKPLLEFGFDGTIGWSATPATGPVRLTNAALDELRASASSMATPAISPTIPLVAIPR